MPNVGEVVSYLDRELNVAAFSDTSNNGLQVANSGRVGVVALGVDASMDFFEAARDRGAGLLICHHGLSWRDSLKTITDLNHRRVAYLVRHDLALYACHLPLDAHPRHGNNARMAAKLGLTAVRPFGLYMGAKVGVQGTLPRPLGLKAFAARVQSVVGRPVQVWPFGKSRVRTVAMVLGGGAVGLEEAARSGVDVYLSGEPNLGAYVTAKDGGLNAAFAGHYATERLGVQALGPLLRRRFGLRAVFVELGVPI